MQRQRFQARRNHQFQIPLGEHRVGIFPVENFALLGDANLPGKTSRRLRQNRRMRRSAAAADSSTAAVEEPQLHSMFLRRAMQLAMRFVKLPGAGEHAAIFVGVRVAEHHFLPASPRVEQNLIRRIAPQSPHHAARGPQRLDGFEQRHRHQARVIVRPLIVRSITARSITVTSIAFRSATSTPAIFARRITASTSFSDSAPLMM